MEQQVQHKAKRSICFDSSFLPPEGLSSIATMELLFGFPNSVQRDSIIIHSCSIKSEGGNSGWIRKPVACDALTRLERSGTLQEATEVHAAKGVIGRALFRPIRYI